MIPIKILNPRSLAMLPLKPGIYYYVDLPSPYYTKSVVDYFKSEIELRINDMLYNGADTPAGMVRGVIIKPEYPTKVCALSVEDRDLLYKFGINPITSINGNGIVICGQQFIALDGTRNQITVADRSVKTWKNPIINLAFIELIEHYKNITEI